MGKISGIQWNGGGYMNPDMPPEVVAALAERGFNPDGSRMATPDRLAAINGRITSDWQSMGFMPQQTVADPRAQYVGNNTDIFVGANSPMAETGPEPFGQETLGKIAGINRSIDADMAEQEAMIAAMEPMMAPMASFGDQMSKPANPYQPREERASAMAPPKPKPRPKPETYTVKAGDNPTTIAKAFGMSLKQLEAKNPGIIRKARRLKPGAKIKV